MTEQQQIYAAVGKKIVERITTNPETQKQLAAAVENRIATKKDLPELRTRAVEVTAPVKAPKENDLER